VIQKYHAGGRRAAMARREDKEAAKKGNFFTNNNDNGNPSVDPKNKNIAGGTRVNRIDEARGNPT